MADLVFADSETRSLLDVTQCGARKYAEHPSTEHLIWGYVFDDEPVGKVWSPEWCWSKKPDKEPTDLLDHIEDGGYFVAWNAFFDRWIWNAVAVKKYGWPPLRNEQVLCAMAQAEANNLPAKLDKACDALGTRYKKDPKGKQLIELLSRGTRESWNAEHENPAQMGHFRSYCLSDCLSMRDVWQHVRPLTLEEWAEYHASEEINDRGVAVDHEFAGAATRYAMAETVDINADMAALTGDPKITITNHLRKAAWLHGALMRGSEELAQIAARPPKKKPDGTQTPRYSADRQTREVLLDALSQPEWADMFTAEHLDQTIKFIELIEAGNSAAVNKFKKIHAYAHGGRVHGSYAFNGAGQTGRFSSRGVQVHNLIRTPLAKGDPDRAIDAIDDIVAGVDAEKLVDTYGLPISRLLARLIRPTFIAAKGHQLVWADWDQIEARVLPWLAKSPGGERKLNIFRSGQDVYKHEAAPIFNTTPDQIADGSIERDVGKVISLACQFGGAEGSFVAMGRNYGVIVESAKAKGFVQKWRAANSWCVHFWHELWAAAINAFNAPGTWYTAGRVRYLYHPNLMRGTLICALPDDRWLVYPQFKHEKTTAKRGSKLFEKWNLHIKTNKDEITKWRTTYMKGFGGGAARVELWYGVCCENITQAVAGSFMRRAIKELKDCVVLHTHDELVCEVFERDTEKTAERIEEVMTTIPTWAEGLPLTVTVESNAYYTK